MYTNELIEKELAEANVKYAILEYEVENEFGEKSFEVFFELENSNILVHENIDGDMIAKLIAIFK